MSVARLEVIGMQTRLEVIGMQTRLEVIGMQIGRCGLNDADANS